MVAAVHLRRKLEAPQDWEVSETMFDNLVESTSNADKNARTGLFFAATAGVWLAVRGSTR